MSNTKVVNEFPRRARNLDFAVFKGQEFRNMGLFFFIHVLDCIEKGEKERNAWLNLAYMMRSAIIPSDEFQAIDINVVNNCCSQFYELYENLFGKLNCTQNLHVFCCHLLQIRTHGPLTETSAFKFESFYGEMRRSFVPGTRSPLKQIMKNIMLKRTMRKHVCRNNIFISNYDTALECNKLVYTYASKQYNIYEISDTDGKTITCHRVGKYPAHFDETPNLNWATVRVFKRGGVSSEPVTLDSSQISGKVLKVSNYLLTCPINVLNEK